MLLRCYVGRPGDEAVVEQTEEELVQPRTRRLTKDDGYYRWIQSLQS
ncbi:hypothetical protein ACT7DA_23780 [Bacillus pacificus]